MPLKRLSLVVYSTKLNILFCCHEFPKWLRNSPYTVWRILLRSNPHASYLLLSVMQRYTKGIQHIRRGEHKFIVGNYRSQLSTNINSENQSQLALLQFWNVISIKVSDMSAALLPISLLYIADKLLWHQAITPKWVAASNWCGTNGTL